MTNELSKELLDKGNSMNFIYIKGILDKFDNYAPKTIVILNLTEELNTFITLMGESLTKYFKSNKRDVTIKDFYNLFVAVIEVYNMIVKFSNSTMSSAVYQEEFIQEVTVRLETMYSYMGSVDSDSAYDIVASNLDIINYLLYDLDLQLKAKKTSFMDLVTFKWNFEANVNTVHNVELTLIDMKVKYDFICN